MGVQSSRQAGNDSACSNASAVLTVLTATTAIAPNCTAFRYWIGASTSLFGSIVRLPAECLLS
jgi:hypothetical protein